MNTEMQKMMRDMFNHLEMFAAAYLKETDIPASEAELVQEENFCSKGKVFHFRRRAANPMEDATGTATNNARDEICADNICCYCATPCHAHTRCKNHNLFTGRKLSPVA